MLTIYNTLTGTKEPFTPMVPGRVGLYVCGMTVYDYCHLGHARVMVVFDVVTRYLRALGYEVTYVRNITDIDDKIIRRAADAGEDIGTLTERYIGFMDEDAQALGVQKPDLEPRATRHIEVMTRMIERLLERGHAYLGKNGDVYYRVASFPEYGKLSGKRPEALRAGARVEVDEAKDDPLDFVLWKHAKPGEPAWASPWGPGRPGWHIECSAMATHSLGDSFDIHGGGQDLQFPHHENEIAQSEGATGQPFARVWMHNGFVQIEEEKMSKSLGNFFTVREIPQRYKPEAVRCLLLASHYRSPLHYSQENLERARQAITRLCLALRDCPDDGQLQEDGFERRFRAAMDDDFNTPEAMAVLFDLAREVNRCRDTDRPRAARLAATLKRLAAVLGVLPLDPDEYLKEPTMFAGASLAPAHATAIVGIPEIPAAPDPISGEHVEELMRQRTEARARKDWQEADRIRVWLAAQGVVLEDGPGGTRWRRG
ncbi:MAG: cysteine--tRNA ligase [Pseudomonadota bacterium]|nr:cysteine--tRNA ligase [Gammaproteobacteria bacterium]MDQ3583852.1 cysteine--tRNA ligase [Pseudomonadota bacterium]